MINNALIELGLLAQISPSCDSVTGFIGHRMEVYDNTDHMREEDFLKEDKAVMYARFEEIANDLLAAGCTKWGNTAAKISDVMCDIIIETCCRYQEYGYIAGFTDSRNIQQILED